jgi:hypothetical protein
VIEIDWTPGPKKLRDFALLLGLVCVLWAGHSAWRRGLLRADAFADPAWWLPLTLVLIGAVAVVLGLAAPKVLRPIYVGWMLAAFPISWVVSNVLLGVTYYVVFTAFATVFRLLGRDELQRRLDPRATTYWRERGPEPPPSRYFKQF